MKKKRRRRRGNNRLAMFTITVVVFILLASMMIQSRTLARKNANYVAQEASLKKQIEAENKRIKEIAELEEYMKTEEYVEKVAKDKLGLIYEDEIIFKPEG